MKKAGEKSVNKMLLFIGGGKYIHIHRDTYTYIQF